MKLVELLARELSEWPEEASHAVQRENGYVGFTYDGKPGRDKDHSDWSINALTASEKAYWLIDAAKSISTIASDHATAIVTSADWSAERARIAKPANKAAKDGWVRHRGGKCPVEAGTVIEYRERNGNIEVECEPELLGSMWFHENHPHDIMAYRLHKPAEHVEACSKPELRSLPENYGEIIGGSAEGPIQWRDRINEIDATAKALTTERAELVQKLASEGFALIGRINDLLTEAAQKHEDMSDWRNWRVGDLVECVGKNDSSFYIAGVHYVVESISQDFYYLDDESDGHHKWTHCREFKWHSRPSA